MEKIKLLGVKLCNTCNLDCEMCAQRKRKLKPHYINSQFLLDTIDQLMQLEKRFEIYFWGGEPFLHPDFFRITKAISERRLPITVNTNGTRLHKYVDEICHSHIRRIIVSIDGTKEIHNQIRGAEVYDVIVEGIRQVKQSRRFLPFLTANVVVTLRNYTALLEIVESLFFIGIEFVEIQLPFFYTPAEGCAYEQWYAQYLRGTAQSWQGFCSNYSDINTTKLIAQVRQLQRIYGEKIHFVPDIPVEDIQSYFLSTLRANPQDICSACAYQVRIEADGSVVLCPDYPDIVLGNITNDSILDILQKEPYQSIRNELASSPLHSLCHKCPFRFELRNSIYKKI